MQNFRHFPAFASLTLTWLFIIQSIHEFVCCSWRVSGVGLAQSIFKPCSRFFDSIPHPLCQFAKTTMGLACQFLYFTPPLPVYKSRPLIRCHPSVCLLKPRCGLLVSSSVSLILVLCQFTNLDRSSDAIPLSVY